MDKDAIIDMLKDYRVALYLILLIASVIVIFPHPGPSGLDTNLQFGLDLDGGSWIQLEFQSAIVTFKSDQTLDTFVPALKTRLDAEVNLIDQNTLEIRKGISEEELRSIFSELNAELVSFNPGVTKETADDVKRILENKINSLGTRDAKVYVITGSMASAGISGLRWPASPWDRHRRSSESRVSLRDGFTQPAMRLNTSSLAMLSSRLQTPPRLRRTVITGVYPLSLPRMLPKSFVRPLSGSVQQRNPKAIIWT
jgi:hypothetical protein